MHFNWNSVCLAHGSSVETCDMMVCLSSEGLLASLTVILIKTGKCDSILKQTNDHTKLISTVELTSSWFLQL